MSAYRAGKEDQRRAAKRILDRLDYVLVLLCAAVVTVHEMANSYAIVEDVISNLLVGKPRRIATVGARAVTGPQPVELLSVQLQRGQVLIAVLVALHEVEDRHFFANSGDRNVTVAVEESHCI